MAERKPEAAPRYDGQTSGPWVARERCRKCGEPERSERHRKAKGWCYYRPDLRWRRLVLVEDD